MEFSFKCHALYEIYYLLSFSIKKYVKESTYNFHAKPPQILKWNLVRIKLKIQNNLQYTSYPYIGTRNDQKVRI